MVEVFQGDVPSSDIVISCIAQVKGLSVIEAKGLGNWILFTNKELSGGVSAQPRSGGQIITSLFSTSSNA